MDRAVASSGVHCKVGTMSLVEPAKDNDLFAILTVESFSTS